MAIREGDWACPNESCINATKMVFGKYDSCPKCGSPKASNGGYGAPGGAQSGDWPCPNQSCMNAHKLVFGRHASCPKCGSARNGGGGFNGNGGGGCYGYSQPRYMPVQSYAPVPAAVRSYRPSQSGGGKGDEGRAEDWSCSNVECINNEKLVFGKYDACPSCGTAKNASTAGDWQCPNSTCANHQRNVFAKKISCPMCGTQRPQRGRMTMPTVSYAYPTRGRPAPAPAFYAPMVPMGKGGGKNDGKSDWQCPTKDCVNHTRFVFGKNDSCPKCGCLKGAGNQGDWRCPSTDCINHTKLVFAKHQSCPKCSAENPSPNGRERSRSPNRGF